MGRRDQLGVAAKKSAEILGRLEVLSYLLIWRGMSVFQTMM
jgi:hypothetical protein